MNRLAVRLLVALFILFPSMALGREESKAVEPYCIMAGNSSDSGYCRTAFTNVLANPYSYHGLRIAIYAWAVRYDEVIVAYPSEESLAAAESVASIVVKASTKSLDRLGSQIMAIDSRGAYIEIVGEFSANNFEGISLPSPDEGRLGLIKYCDKCSSMR